DREDGVDLAVGPVGDLPVGGDAYLAAAQDPHLGPADVGAGLQLVHQGEEEPPRGVLDHHHVEEAVVDPGVGGDDASGAVVAGVGGDHGVAGEAVLLAVDGDGVAGGPPGGDGAQAARVVG